MAASRQRIKATDLYKSVGMILDGYEKEISQNVDRAANQESQKLIRDLQNDSPKRTRAYAQSWGRVKEGGVYIVRNQKHWRLTHLLEDGHRKRGGNGMVKAFPHIAKAAEKAAEAFERAVKKVLGGN